MKIKMPKHYWHGDECIERRIPWMVPDAIYALDRFITKDDTVLEIGGGGSTLFFSDRAKEVVTFDSSLNWVEQIGRPENAAIFLVKNWKEIDGILKEKYLRKKFNVIVVDWDLNRDFMAPLLPTYLEDRFCVVLDNYNCPFLFPFYFNHDFMGNIPVASYCREYNDAMWRGSGTRIYSSEPL